MLRVNSRKSGSPFKMSTKLDHPLDLADFGNNLRAPDDAEFNNLVALLFRWSKRLRV